MFRLLGKAITRFWPISLVAWVGVLITTAHLAPPWESITKDSDVAFLPEQSPSSRGDLLFQESFPDQRSGSSIVLVVARATDKLSDEDQAFVTDTLAPELVKLGKEHPDLFRKVRTMGDGSGGALLVSPDRHATVVIVDLAAAFLEPKSYPLVKDVEDLVQQLEKEAKVPSGLDIHLTGSATAGRDLAQAQAQSVHAIERWTIVVVVVLLILLYRAPLLALIPLATVYVGVQISFNLLAMMGEANILTLSGDVRIFVTVLAYGAGVDYCLFLISRYREELLTGIEPRQAMTDAISRVGTAVSASAATVICGIGVLAFMQFGKIREAGIVIPFALFIVLCGTLTFTTALLLLAGRWAFWPHRRPAPHEPKTLAPSLLHRLAGIDIWKEVGSWMLRWPGAIWVGTVAIMVPFAAYALVHYEDETYNPIGDLPKDAQSVAGSNVLEKYFPPGILGPTSVFIVNRDVDFGSIKGINLIAQVTDRLAARRQELDLADIRSVAKPLGVTPAGEVADSASGLGRSVRRARAAHFYVSRTAEWKGHLTRLDLVLTKNPFSVEAVDVLNRIQQELQASLPDALKGSEVVTAGATITIRDLAQVKSTDLQHVEIFVPLVIFVLLWLVLHRVAISIYLVLSVLLSYLATMGITFLVFWAIYPNEFIGLDWKVPIFLFTILVAVGEDYNIFLITRIKEEQEAHGAREGVLLALRQTGRVISSCGFIMAGTFASLFSGSLLAMKELAFALSFGILLDTLVVRPILVPTFLILLDGRFGTVGKYLALYRGSKA